MINLKNPPLNFHDELHRLYFNPKKEVKTVSFQITDDCCMRCSYCYQINKSHNKMSFDTAKKFIDKILNLDHPLDYINPSNTLGIIFEFIGGEPFLEIELIKQISDYITNRMIELNHPWLFKHRFSLCSNGLLYFNPLVQDYLKKYNNRLSFTISLDGNKELHDSCRVDCNGEGTYDRVISAVKHYQNNFNKNLSTKVTFSPENIKYVSDALINLINLDYKEIYANCIFESGWTNHHGLIYYNELKKVADFILNSSKDFSLYLSLFSLQDFEKAYTEENWCGGVNNHMLAYDYQGNFYPCLRYMEDSLNNEQPPIIIGNINHGIYVTEKEQDFRDMLINVTRKSQSSEECYNCPIGSGCSWCSAYNYQISGTVNHRLTYICPMHYARALANQYFFKKYYQKNKQPFYNLHIPKEKALEIISQTEWEELFE